ncbi:hypothetical protein TKK_0012524 [Trichogramma kaykai]|uniref:Amino acid transporter transmembrane domain-containing protein n=1 Tax=Trichogramma kaykai TaxID=54128 RepID=A0ABD2WMI6_9HYME
MSHDNYGFTGSMVTVDVNKTKSNSANLNANVANAASNNKYPTKDGANNGFYVVELEDKSKLAKEDAESYEPYLHREVQHPTTFWETLLHLMKGSLGTGILAMPHAFKNSGWVVGIIGTIIVGLLCTYCIRLLLNAHYELCKRRQVPSMTYPRTMQVALEEGPTCLRGLAKYCPHVTNAFLLIYQLGTCCVYTVFIAVNLSEVINHYTFPYEVNKKYIMLATLLPLILINWVRNLKLLVPLSTIANIITLGSFGIILYFLFNQGFSFEGAVAVGEFGNFPLFLGTVLFSLEAIGVIMPLENEMKKPKKFMTPFGVLNIGMAINVILYVGMGFFGYIRYGDLVEGSITTNLSKSLVPQSAEVYLAQAVQVMLAIAIFVTHSLQCYVAIDISWNEYIQPKLSHYSERAQLYREYAVRTAIVIFTFIVAVIVPELDLFISLFGALCLSALGLSFPALMQTCTFWKTASRRTRAFMLAKNGSLICFGVLALFIGTSTSISKIVEKFGETPATAAH